MTETYNSPPHDYADGHEHDGTHAEDGAVNELPPDYEFGSGDEHSATVTEENGDHGADLTGEAKSTKRSVFPLVAGAGGLLLIGALAWWQFSGSNNAVESAEAPRLPQIAVPNPGLPVTTGAAALKALDTTSVAPKSASALVPAGDIPAPVAFAPAPVSAPAPLAMAPLPAPVAALAPSSAASDARIASLTARVEDLQKALDQTTQQLNQISSKMAGAPAPTAADTGLADRLAKVEQRLAQVHTTSPVVAPVPVLASPAAITEKDALPDTLRLSVKPVSHAKHVVHAVKAKSASMPAPVIISGDTKPSSNWMLRAAIPGEAWVSTAESSRDLKDVHVGDTLAGIGRVTVIGQQDDGWFVKGTKGTIR